MKSPLLVLERLIILAAAAAYLVVFNQTQPHGDALRIVRQIEAGHLIWNPNHLIFDPLGYGLYHLLHSWLPTVTPLGCFELISAASTIVSLLMFHAILIRVGITQTTTRLVAVLVLFASATFVSLSVSQYYFMVQLPLLLAVLYLYVDFLLDSRIGTARNFNLYAIGTLLALATALMFNNLLLVIVSGIGVGLMHRSWRRFDWRHSLRLYATAAVVGFPIFLIGYLLADVDTHLFRWLLSYGGVAVGPLNDVFGAKWTPSGVISGAAMIGFNLLLGCIVDTAGFGTVLSVVFFGQPFEFIPQWNQIVPSLMAIPAVIVVNVSIASFALRRLRTEPAVRFLTLWILAFVAFNFLWGVGDEIFWFQIVPAIWILFFLSQGAASATMLQVPRVDIASRSERWRTPVLGLFASLLLIVNTTNAVAPGADNSFHYKQLQHADLLREGDLEIFPGWDQQKWLMLPEGTPKIERLILMNLAVGTMKSDKHMSDLPEIVQSHLDSGRRVIVARVFDLDRDSMPWYMLRDMGWSRERLESLFDRFCNRVVAVIDGIVFREISHCDRERGLSPYEETSLRSRIQ